MEKLQLNNYGVSELSTEEMQNVNGGGFILDTLGSIMGFAKRGVDRFLQMIGSYLISIALPHNPGL